MDLVVEQLGVARGGRRILRDVSFSCPAGSAVVLRGPNGVGKTSLLRVLAGFATPVDGQARLGSALLGDGDGFQEHVAYAGHADGIKGALSLAENLTFWSRACGGITSADAALARMGLTDQADRLGAACSAGQRRRAGLARLLVSGRRMWLLDEPSVSLDAASVDILRACLADHLAGGGLAILATHDADIVDAPRTVTLAPAQDTEADDPFLDEAFA